MSTNYERTALSINADTLQGLQTLSVQMGRNVSWSADIVITRYLSLMRIITPQVKEKFDSDEIWEIAKAIKAHINSLRTANFRRLKSLLVDLKEDKQLDASIVEKAMQLSEVELLCLIELSEIRIKQGKIIQEKATNESGSDS